MKNNPWISGDTFKAVLERSNLNGKINNDRSIRVKSNLQTKYYIKDKETKRLVRRDERKVVDDMVTKAD